MPAKRNVAKLTSTTLVTNDSAPPYPFAHQFKQTTALESEGCPHRPTHSGNITPGLQPSGDTWFSEDYAFGSVYGSVTKTALWQKYGTPAYTCNVSGPLQGKERLPN